MPRTFNKHSRRGLRANEGEQYDPDQKALLRAGLKHGSKADEYVTLLDAQNKHGKEDVDKFLESYDPNAGTGPGGGGDYDWNGMPESWAREIYDREGQDYQGMVPDHQVVRPDFETWLSKKEGFYSLAPGRLDQMLANGEITQDQYDRTKAANAPAAQPVMDEIRDAITRWKGSKNPKDWARIRLALGGFGVGGSMTKAKGVNPDSTITRKDLLALGQELGLVDKNGSFNFGDKGIDELPEWGKEKMQYLTQGPGPDGLDEDEDEDPKPEEKPGGGGGHDDWHGPRWIKGIFLSLDSETGWVDIKGHLGQEGKYYNYSQIRKLFNNDKMWQNRRQEWRDANGWDEDQKGWVDGPPGGGLGSMASYFDEFYRIREANGGEIPEGTMIHDLKVEDLMALIGGKASVKRGHDRWAAQQPRGRGIELTGEKPWEKPGDTPDDLPNEASEFNEMGLRRTPRSAEDHEGTLGQIQQLIAQHDGGAVEGADILDLINSSRSFDNRLQFLAGRTGAFDWRDMSFDQSRFFPTPEEGILNRGMPRPGRQYDPWAWDRDGKYSQYKNPNASLQLQRGQEFLGGKPADDGTGTADSVLRKIEEVPWGKWIEDMERQKYAPGAVKSLAYDHWQPDYTTEEIDGMLASYFDQNIEAEGARTAGTTTGADTGAIKANAMTQDYESA